jgi:predicted nucleic acid-binding Zn finger protein
MVEIPRWTWIWVGQEEMVDGWVSISSVVFRSQVVYVEDVVPLLAPGSVVFRVGLVRLGVYTVNLALRHCTCPSYRYVRNGTRHCKHLDRLCEAQSTVEYTQEKLQVELLSETVPSKSCVYADWIYSPKYDGIRIRVKGRQGWTRGGMKIDLSSIWTPPAGSLYECELCLDAKESSTHDAVMVQVLAGRVQTLRLVVFDLFDPTRTCGQRLLQLWGLSLPPAHVVRYEMVQLWRGVGFLSRLAALDIGSAGFEGVVVRNPAARSDPRGRRSNRVAFKIKKGQWDRLVEVS